MVAEVVSVFAAVERDLALLDKSLAESSLAASALTLAAEMDAPGNSATSKSMCAKALLETMDRLRKMAPAVAASDGLDELTSKREGRLARAASR